MPTFMQQSNGPSMARRVLFVVLIIAALAMLVVYANEGDEGPLHSSQSQVMSVTDRFASYGAGTGAAVESAGDVAANATADPDTLEGLRQQNEELRQLLADAEEYRQEVDRLRGLLDMKQVSAVTGPVAHVIGRSTSAWNQSITIDLGSEDGVVSGMTVMGSTGVIGQVSRAAAHTSTVRLLTDPNSGAAVMVQSSRANGIVRGSLNGLLYLEDVDEDQLPVVGDVILTSGLGGSYERGLIVGAVVSVGDSTSNAVSTIIVNPNDSAEMLEEVIVVFKAPKVNVPAASSDSADSQDGETLTLDGQIESSDVNAVETEDPTEAAMLEGEWLAQQAQEEEWMAEEGQGYEEYEEG